MRKAPGLQVVVFTTITAERGRRRKDCSGNQAPVALYTSRSSYRSSCCLTSSVVAAAACGVHIPLPPPVAPALSRLGRPSIARMSASQVARSVVAERLLSDAPHVTGLQGVV